MTLVFGNADHIPLVHGSGTHQQLIQRLIAVQATDGIGEERRHGLHAD